MKKLLVFGFYLVLLSACGDDDRPDVDPDKVITKIVFRFYNANNTTDFVEAEWYDEDGKGGQDPIVEPIVLDASKTYLLTLQYVNTLETPPGQVTEEIVDEADEHQIFFGFTSDVFADPAGEGNISSSGSVNYMDDDENGLPLGVTTSWTTGDPATGNFRAVLKHQPGIKSASSTVSDGKTDSDITLQLIIQ